MNRPISQGIVLKKRYGQHFLRDTALVQRIVSYVSLTPQSSVFEIGCGDGFLTKAIITQPFKQYWIFEIDPEWAELVKNTVHDARLTIFLENILDVDFTRFEPYAPWVLLANLPYQITFPILHLLQRNRHMLQEGVIMVQEEVAQKIMKAGGRDYGFSSLYFQRFFQWRLLDKISPSAFYPPPKVYSRLLHFKPILNLEPIPDEEEFWKFIKAAFKQPRRTLKNNLSHTNFVGKISEDKLGLRAQQLSMEDFIELWKVINT